MNSDERMKNYHWTESDISDWSKEKILKELLRRNYEVVTLDVFVKICSRMNSLGLIYIINMDTILDNKSCVLENFTTTHVKEIPDFPWFLDFFKELEGQAILQFSKNVIDLQNKERESVGVPKIEAKEKTKGNFQYSSLINCNPSEFKDFLFKEDLIRMWANKENEYYRIGRVVFSINNEELNFKLDNWDSFVKVEMSFKDIRGSTKIDLKMDGVPIKDLDVMRGVWRENVFMPICMTFGYTERLYEE